MYPRNLSISYSRSISIIYIVIADVFLGLATLAVGIRLWSRKIQRQSFVLNDYAAMLGWVFTVGFVITSTEFALLRSAPLTDSMEPAIGQKLDKVCREWIRSNSLPAFAPMLILFAKFSAVNAIGWAVANTSIKISIVHFYITLFRSNRTFLRIAYAVMTLLSAFGVAVVIAQLLRYLLTARSPFKSWESLKLGLFFGVPSDNMAVDVIIILLPMPMIWGLQMAMRRKIELTIMFALGSIVCILTIIRLVWCTEEKFQNPTYATAMYEIPAILEPRLGIIIACLPFFPPAIKNLTGRTDQKTHLQTRNTVSSPMARMRLKRSMKSSTLQSSSDNPSSLTDLDLEAKGTQNDIKCPTSGKAEYMFGGHCDQYAGARIPPQPSSIMVEHDFEIRSDEVE